MKISVMIVDDHEIFRSGIKNLINTTSWGVCNEEAGKIDKEALAVIRKTKPDILLLDLYLEGGHRSFENIKSVRENSPLTKIVILTVSEDEEDIYEATHQNVEGYILKSTPFGKMEKYLVDIFNGNIRISESLASTLFKEVTKHNITKPLSDRENEVLQLVADGYSNKQIAQNLCISVYTVKNHVSSLLRKMNAKNRHQLAISFLKKNTPQTFGSGF
ncbi:MAG TPA: response regulator transcription factor [Firmicutes bacterium]|jgi:DNA-binding NarL/FixJ family response regulator|nr:response regulator transcription factor [Bacillota bacterium]